MSEKRKKLPTFPSVEDTKKIYRSEKEYGEAISVDSVALWLTFIICVNKISTINFETDPVFSSFVTIGLMYVSIFAGPHFERVLQFIEHSLDEYKQVVVQESIAVIHQEEKDILFQTVSDQLEDLYVVLFLIDNEDSGAYKQVTHRLAQARKRYEAKYEQLGISPAWIDHDYVNNLYKIFKDSVKAAKQQKRSLLLQQIIKLEALRDEETRSYPHQETDKGLVLISQMQTDIKRAIYLLRYHEEATDRSQQEQFLEHYLDLKRKFIPQIRLLSKNYSGSLAFLVSEENGTFFQAAIEELYSDIMTRMFFFSEHVEQEYSAEESTALGHLFQAMTQIKTEIHTKNNKDKTKATRNDSEAAQSLHTDQKLELDLLLTEADMLMQLTKSYQRMSSLTEATTGLFRELMVLQKHFRKRFIQVLPLLPTNEELELFPAETLQYLFSTSSLTQATSSLEHIKFALAQLQKRNNQIKVSANATRLAVEDVTDLAGLDDEQSTAQAAR